MRDLCLEELPSIEEVLAATKDVMVAREEAARLERQAYNRRDDVRAMKRAYHERIRKQSEGLNHGNKIEKAGFRHESRKDSISCLAEREREFEDADSFHSEEEQASREEVVLGEAESRFGEGFEGL